MRFTVYHETRYRYSAPVRLGRHLLRLTPRAEGVVSFSYGLEVAPVPCERRDEQDAFGTSVTVLDFSGETEELRIAARIEALTRTPSPVDPEGLPLLPWAGAAVDEAPEVMAFSRALAAEAGGRAGAFLDLLTARLFERTRRHIRPEGAARSAAETLALGSGACRDLTVLFMAVCRVQGIPARFVSGYQARAETPDGRRHLHAWPEAALPRVGWRGYDPTHGVAVGDGHLALAAAPDQAATMPVEGGFWGDGVSSTLDYRIEIGVEEE